MEFSLGKSFWVGEHVGWGVHEDAGRTAHLERVWTLHAPSHISQFYPFTINWKSNKKKVSLSSSSTFSKLIEPKEEIIGTSDL